MQLDKQNIKYNIKQIFHEYNYKIKGKFKSDDEHINDIDIHIKISKDKIYNLIKIISSNFNLIYIQFSRYSNNIVVKNIVKKLEKVSDPEEFLKEQGFRINLKYINKYPKLLEKLIKNNYNMGIFAYIYKPDNKLYEFYDFFIKWESYNDSNQPNQSNKKSSYYKMMCNNFNDKEYYWALSNYFIEKNNYRDIKYLKKDFLVYFWKEALYYNKMAINRYTYQHIPLGELPDIDKINKKVYRKYYSIMQIIKSECTSNI